MGENVPIVSIGLPAYNEARHLRETLESLLGQECADFELIIGDNASTDATGEIARQYATKDSRIRYFRNDENVGSVVNAERVFAMARGKYFLMAAGHDLYDPRFLEECVARMEQNDSVVLTYPLCRSVDEGGRMLEAYPPQFGTENMPAEKRLLELLRRGESYFIYGLYRRDTLAKTMPFRQSLGPDVLILAELSLLGEFAYVPEPLFHMRQTHDITHLKSHLSKLNFRVGLWRSPKMCLALFGNLFAIICKRCNSRRKRLYLYPRAWWIAWRRWHRLIIAILIAGVSPKLLDCIQRKRGKAAAIDENH